MALYAIGDLHLHFASELKAPGQLKGKVWQGHEERFREYCLSNLRESDTLLLLGDHSWGKTPSECEPDLEYIAALPGNKILLRGNHDMFWDAKKTAKLNERYAGRLSFLQNNHFSYGGCALVGTKGFCFEGPFRVDRSGRILDWDKAAKAHADELVSCELDRLEASFVSAISAGFSRFIMLLHYPPTSAIERESGFTKMAEKYRVEQVVYAHCHGESRFHDSIIGMKNGVRYDLASGDYLKWKPLRLAP